MDYAIMITLGLFGLILGSYSAATVWRLRARQLTEDKKAGEKVDTKEYKRLLPLTKETVSSDRSRCLNCGHKLAWYDLLPLVSWVSLRGKCRYCRKSIGVFEPAMELGVASMFVLSYAAWPLTFDTTIGVVQFVLWLVALVMLAILFAYDMKWFLLPDRIMFPLIGVSPVFATLAVVAAPDAFAATVTLAVAAAILSGLYFLLWMVSKGQWIGFGDVKLGLALALLLGNWELAFIALFTANLIGCLLVIPGMLVGKVTRSTRIPFGPLLVAGAVIAFFAGTPIINWYMGIALL